MCSSCSCCKYRQGLPASMDCAVRDHHPVHLYSPTEYGIEDSCPFYISASPLCFAEDDRPRHGSRVNKQKLSGGMTATVSTLLTCLRLLPAAALLCIPHSMVLLIWEVKCFLFITHFKLLSQVFFFFFFFLSIQVAFNICFVLLQPVWLQEFFIRAASLATLHERWPRDLQRVSVELVW